ncbi:MAG: acyl-CoA dehydrogenase family protein [Ilumatobacteraceae bacterium]
MSDVLRAGAGSDVASLQTKAELDGDEWILNGQKVWTTLAHVSDYGIVIARTDPDQPKHAGISMFIIDLKSPGVEIRSIHQIDGGRHFNEVFFTDVRLPKDNLIGDLNNGWRLATGMLMYERVAIGSSGSGSISQPTYKMLVKHASPEQLQDPTVRDALMKLYCMESTKAMVALRTRAELKAGKTPGPGGSLGKLAGSIIARYARGLALELAGPSSIAWEGAGGDDLQRYVLNSFQAGIAGGTDEIQRNIIGDRGLGLPRNRWSTRTCRSGSSRSAPRSPRRDPTSPHDEPRTRRPALAARRVHPHGDGAAPPERCTTGGSACWS